ncbi:MAG: glycoside hydrolase family 127 protein [Clostridia bacterium]|nr:glycoside hydrolase family 127 protein [Clostridia bacterium]
MKLKTLAMQPLTTNEIKPKGWLLRQLRIQADGLSGHLDEFWKDVKDSKWIGGPCESWERVPYWLDGFIPLAYLLDDELLKAKAKKYIDGILDRQCADGWICPCELRERGGYDTWAALLICKSLMVYYDCAKDERALEATYRALRQLSDHLDNRTLFNWGAARWFEGLIPLYRVAEIKGFEPWMEMLTVKLGAQGFDYSRLFKNWAYKKPVSRWNLMSHVVNQAMMIKSEALYSRYSGGSADAFAEKAYSLLMKHHGQAYGHFSGDECLSGTEPTQGTELCGVVEAMYSYEVLASITGEAKWGDRLEAAAVNALPATVSPDMCSHQYDQMANQIECSLQPKENVVFRTNHPDANIFGLEPNFGCCTANMHQGFPKLALATFFRNSSGFTAWLPYPAELDTLWDGKKVRIETDTLYPFRDTVEYTVENEGAEFDLSIRVPGTAKSAIIDGNTVNPGEIAVIHIGEGEKKRAITMKLEYEIRLEKRPSGMYCVRRGSLLYALKLNEKWEQFDYDHMPGDTGTERVYPFCDYTLTTDSRWGYGFCDRLEPELTLRDMGEYPFSSEGAPCVITVNARELPWVKEFGRCRPRPESTQSESEPERIELIPYGCTHLRMTELPRVK